MNFLKTIITSTILVVTFLNSAQAMQFQIQTAKERIQRELDYFKVAAGDSTSSTRTCEETTSNIKWKLTAMRMNPNWMPLFTLQCEIKEIQDHFKGQLT